MSTVTLRKVAINDLSLKYAREMGGNKIRHYRVPFVHTLLKGNEALELIKEHIRKEEGKESGELEFVIEASASLLSPMVDGMFCIEDVSTILNSEYSDVKKALFKMSAKGQLVETIKHGRHDKLINFISSLVNPVIACINRVLQKLQNLQPQDIFEGRGRFLSMMQTRYPKHFFNLAKYLTVAFEAKDYKKAQESLLKDLRILADNGLILGHLAKPSLMALADTVGSAEQQCVLFCFPIIDAEKFSNLCGEDDGHDKLKLLGIANETPEGSVNWLDGITPEQKYDIEVINVVSQTSEDRQKMVQEAYDLSVPLVNRAANVTRRLMKVYPEEFKKAEEELTNAMGRAHERALTESRLKVAKSLSKKKSKKKPTKKRKTKKTKKVNKRK